MSEERVPQEQLHPILEEGNKVPREIVEILQRYADQEPRPLTSKRIALGLTVLRQLDGKWSMRWMQALRQHWWPGPIYNGKGQYTVMARNYVLKQAFDDLDSWDALLFWDSDNVLPLVVPGPLSNGWPGGWFLAYLDYLMDHELDKGVIAGLYPSREDYWQTDDRGNVKAGPHEPVAYHRNTDGTYGFLQPAELIPMLQRPGLYPVGGAGTGTMLIRKEILLELAELKAPKPVFQGPKDVIRDLWNVAIADQDSEARREARSLIYAVIQGGEMFEAPDLKAGESGGGPGSQWTEDLYFCHEVATKLHKTIWLDSAMQTAHVAEIWITFAHYLEARGFGAGAHAQSFRNARPVNQSQENERRKSRIVLPR